jgi:hypothetical protein
VANPEAAQAIVLLVLIGLAESVTAFVNPKTGVVAHVFLLIFIFALAATTDTSQFRTFLLVVSLAPLIRIVSLTMPLAQFPQAYWYVLTAIPILLSGAIIVRMQGLSPASLGLRLPAREWVVAECLVAGVGIPLGYVEWKILQVPPIVDTRSIPLMIGAGIILLFFTGFFEEFVFRGLIQTVASERFGPLAGILFSVAVFTILHAGWQNGWDLLFVAGVAAYFSVVVYGSHSLVGVTFSHGAINTMLFIVLPLTIGAVAAPKDLRAVAKSSSNVTLSWAKSEGPTGYRIKINRDACYTVLGSKKTSMQLPPKQHGTIDSRCSHTLHLQPGTRYRWKVYAVFGATASPLSQSNSFYISLASSTLSPRPSGPFWTVPAARTGTTTVVNFCWRFPQKTSKYSLLVSGARHHYNHWSLTQRKLKTGRHGGHCYKVELPSGKSYAWRVGAFVKGYFPTWSRWEHFRITPVVKPTPTPTITSSQPVIAGTPTPAPTGTAY